MKKNRYRTTNDKINDHIKFGLNKRGITENGINGVFESNELAVSKHSFASSKRDCSARILPKWCQIALSNGSMVIISLKWKLFGGAQINSQTEAFSRPFSYFSRVDKFRTVTLAMGCGLGTAIGHPENRIWLHFGVVYSTKRLDQLISWLGLGKDDPEKVNLGHFYP